VLLRSLGPEHATEDSSASGWLQRFSAESSMRAYIARDPGALRLVEDRDVLVRSRVRRRATWSAPPEEVPRLLGELEQWTDEGLERSRALFEKHFGSTTKEGER
jgi:hypothetical protein